MRGDAQTPGQALQLRSEDPCACQNQVNIARLQYERQRSKHDVDPFLGIQPSNKEKCWAIGDAVAIPQIAPIVVRLESL
jgi:hypothetical protein